MAADRFDEFSFVADDAARLGVREPLPVRRVSVETDRGRVSALAWGDFAPEYVFLHGAGLNAHSWDSVALALGRPAIAIDLPGHGDSAWREEFDYAPLQISGAVSEVIRQLCPAPVTLVGQSRGGLTAIAVADELGSLVTRLVVVDISPGHRPRQSPARVREFIAGPESYASPDEIVDRALEFGIGRDREAIARGVLLNTRVRPDGRYVFKHHLANPPEGAVLEYDSLPLWPIIEGLEVPILLVFGTTGILDSGEVEEFADRLPSAQVLSLEAGHNVQRDAPRELATAIAAFAANHP